MNHLAPTPASLVSFPPSRPSPILSSYTEQLFYARRPVPEVSSPSPSLSSSSTATTTGHGMPRPNPPPTPGSSSDIRGRETTQTAPAFHLPPAAYHDHPERASTGSATPSTNGSDSSYRPVSPTSPANASSRTKIIAHQPPSGPVITKDDFSLPPPPTRSRKIIQMKPRDREQTVSNASAPAPPTASSPPSTGKTTAAAAGQSGGNGGGGGGKRKQANAGTTAAGRKIARKTAHSLIERRRRSKMNEEFGVLKDMIPACRGQEMHKLAILQASIEYLRYLEQCVSDLQAQNTHVSSVPPPPTSLAGRSGGDEDEEADEDEEMEDDHEADPKPSELRTSSSLVSLPPLSQITSNNTNTTSPSIFSTGAGRHYSISSAASHAGYSPLYPSNQTSPAFGPQLHHLSTAGLPYAPGTFGLGSPALQPLDAASSHLRHIAESANERAEQQQQQQQQQQRHHRLASSSSSVSSSSAAVHPNGPHHPASHVRSERDLDHEATAALLMLNHDRRNWRAAHEPDTSARSSTGMSVKDLLSG